MPFLVRNWKTSEGLPHNAVESLLQTRDGWLWVGTRQGLARFDGLKFTIYNAQTPGFTDDAAIDLAEDAEGHLWIGTKRGLYRKRGGAFEKFTTAQGLPDNQILDLCKGQDGSMWIATGGGLSCFTAGKFTHYPYVFRFRSMHGSETHHHIFSVTVDRGRDVWAGSLQGLLRLDQTTGKFREVWRDAVTKETFGDTAVRVIHEASDGALWFGTDVALVRKRGDEFTRYPSNGGSNDPRFTSIAGAADGTIWVAKGGTLKRVDQEGAPAPAQVEPIEHLFITDTLEDRAGTRWIATRYGGLFRLRPLAAQTLTTHDGLCHNTVLSVSPSRQGGVWVGTARGFQRRHDGRFEFPWVHVPSIPSRSLDATTARCPVVFEDRAGNLWGFRGADERNDLWLEVEDHAYRPQDYVSGPPRAILEDKLGRIWIAGEAGVTCLLTNSITGEAAGVSQGPVRKRGIWWRFDPDQFLLAHGARQIELRDGEWSERRTAHLQSLTAADPSAPFLDQCPLPAGCRLSCYDARAIVEDPDGAIWFGTWGGGVNRVAGGRLEAFSVTNGLAGNFVNWLHAGTDGALWVGTTEGLSRIQAGQVATITTRYGLPHDSVHQILEDDLGYFWLGGRHGLFRVSRDDLLAVVDGRAASLSGLLLDQDDAMLASETQSGSHHTACKTPDGRLWFATAQGLVMVDPAQIRAPIAPPAVFIEQLRAPGGSLDVSPPSPISHLPSAISGTTPINPAQSASRLKGAHESGAARSPWSVVSSPLPPGSGRYIELHFTALDLDTPERLRFKYRLDGCDEDWVDAGERRVAYYTNLRPGNYRFQVLCGNKHGDWSSPGAALAFAIAPSFYQTKWFAGVCGVCLLAGIAAVHQTASRAVRRKQRSDITRALHDRLGGKLSAIIKTADALIPSAISLSQSPVHPADSGASSPISHLPSPIETSLELPTAGPAAPPKNTIHESFADIAQLAQSALRNLRHAISAGDPGDDTLDALVTQLIQLAEELLPPLNIRLRLDVPLDVPKRRVSPRFRECVSLVVSEALNNVVKHASATTVHLRVSIQANNLSAEIQDKGKGFTPSEAPQICRSTHPSIHFPHGLANMRANTAAIRAKLEILSAPNQGTTVRLTATIR